MSWLLQILGLDNGSGIAYLFWSGLGGDLPIFAAIGLFYWHHSCHQNGCWRWARHAVGPDGIRVCRKHHPALPQKITTEHIKAAHAGARRL